MSNTTENKSRRASPELVAVLSLGVTILLAVLGQAAWLDGKIERADARLGAQIESTDARLGAQIESTDARLGAQIKSTDARLGAQIESLHAGQTAIRERLAALEARSSVAGTPAAGNEQPPDSAF